MFFSNKRTKKNKKKIEKKHTRTGMGLLFPDSVIYYLKEFDNRELEPPCRSN